LVVYDMLGRKVKTLVDERQSAGRKTATLRGRALSSGVYVFRLQIGDYTETGRLVHVR
jgi:5-hydroxyisourate hydrolase-like protein (transthyretin family)